MARKQSSVSLQGQNVVGFITASRGGRVNLKQQVIHQATPQDGKSFQAHAQARQNAAG